MKHRVIWILLIGLGAFLSCSENTQKTASEVQWEREIPEDFLYFLDDFHEDLEFQKAHIVWPLQGLPSIENSTNTENFRWQEADWVMHQSFDPENDEFEQSFTILGDDLVIERIVHINKSLGMERRFARRDSSWNLIYYAGMNFLKQE